MATLFFGDRWDAPVVDDAVQVPTPVGERCVLCGEDVVDGDRGLMIGPAGAVHAECQVLGVMGHEVEVCPCHGYGSDRAAARLVWERVGQLRGRDLGSQADA